MPLQRSLRGGLIAAVVFSVYACATGLEDGRDGFEALEDASAEASPPRDASVAAPRDAGTSPQDETGGGPCDGKVVINEIMTAGTTSANEEFVELYNPGACAVPLAGWRVGYRSYSGTAGPPIHTFAAGASIPAKSFLVLGRAEFKGKKDVTVTGGSMAGENGQVGLEDDTGAIVDSVGYGTTTGVYVEKAPAQSPAAGGSISRRSDGVDTDNNAADFAKTTPHSAGAPNP
jgi:hypothetical protein